MRGWHLFGFGLAIGIFTFIVCSFCITIVTGAGSWLLFHNGGGTTTLYIGLAGGSLCGVAGTVLAWLIGREM